MKGIDQQVFETLPQPPAEAQHLSQQLVDLIRSEMHAQGGQITFARYMEL
ncbi:MAG: hypothetical protein HUJ30_08480, partial [Gammaproteobacteria bacterium]|nr:hypothetical protein [Gammaproteobacteria bacterium]